MQPLRRDHREAGIGIPQHQHRVRPLLRHELIGRGDDVADGLAQIRADGIQVEIRRPQTQILKKDLVERIVIVLPGVDKDLVKILVAGLDRLAQANDLRPRADDGHEFQLRHAHTSK